MISMAAETNSLPVSAVLTNVRARTDAPPPGHDAEWERRALPTRICVIDSELSADAESRFDGTQ